MQCKSASNSIRNNKIILILIIILLAACIQPKRIDATETTVVKVGYPIVNGFTEKENGVYSGYAYEYLTEISKYTGWEYEFVEMNVNDMINKLRDGEIDLAAGMYRNDQTLELYDIPETNAGYSYTTLSVLRDNEAISSSNYETLNGIKVGYYESDKTRISNFIAFCDENGIEDVELVAYPLDGKTSLSDMLKAKEVDGIIKGDLSISDEEKVMAKFAATPYYFATTKGNKKIFNGLKKALVKIKENDSNFEEKLYHKYFQDNNDFVVNLTQEERNYINNMTPLKAVYVDNFAPMQDYNEKTMQAEGVYIDIAELIAQKVGIKYELVKASNHEEAFQMMKNKEVDLFITSPDDYLKATEYDYSLTQGYYVVNMAKVVNVKEKNKERKQIIALPRGYFFTEFEGEYEIQYFESVEDCLVAVNKGEADATYGNSYTLSRYISLGYYSNLSIIFDEAPIKAAIGIAKPTNLILLDIINKTVSSLSDSEINNIIYSNTINVKNNVTLKQFFLANSTFCIAIILVFVLLICIIFRTRYKRLEKDKSILLEKSQIDVLTGLYNRATGTDLVTDLLQKKEPSLYNALMIIDIDHFKQINDNLGHQKGDDLLVEFSQLLQQVFSYEDIIFRLGGDEFIVFIANLKSSNLHMIDEKLEEICKIMNKEVIHMGHCQTISLSIGGVVTNQVHDFLELYHEADNMLYEVKRNGRNGFKIKNI